MDSKCTVLIVPLKEGEKDGVRDAGAGLVLNRERALLSLWK